MNEMIKSPKELRDDADESEANVEKYLCKFVNTKYKFEFISVNSDNFPLTNNQIDHICLNFDYYPFLSILCDEVYCVYLTSKISSYCVYDGDNMEQIDEIDEIDEIKSDPLYKPQYLQALLFFSKPDNIKEFCDYITRTYKFLYLTTYIPSLPKAYMFLLCNFHSRTFPKEIAKLIAHKILFFLPPKKLKKRNKE